MRETCLGWEWEKIRTFLKGDRFQSIKTIGFFGIIKENNQGSDQEVKHRKHNIKLMYSQNSTDNFAFTSRYSHERVWLAVRLGLKSYTGKK